jgi:hypothetical protein
MNSNNNNSNTNSIENELNNRSKFSDLSSDYVASIISFILSQCNFQQEEAMPACGALTTAATIFRVSNSTVTRIWKKAQESKNNPQINSFFGDFSKRGNCGRYKVHNDSAIASALAELPYYQRQTFRAMSQALGINVSTLYNIYAKKKIITKHTARIKPFLSAFNRYDRLSYCASQVVKVHNDHCFDTNYNTVHIDEKWFFCVARI